MADTFFHSLKNNYFLIVLWYHFFLSTKSQHPTSTKMLLEEGGGGNCHGGGGVGRMGGGVSLDESTRKKHGDPSEARDTSLHPFVTRQNLPLGVIAS